MERWLRRRIAGRVITQHDRMMRAISERRRGVPLVVGGDMHATAAGTIQRSGRLDLRRNPVHVAFKWDVGQSRRRLPSGLRGTLPRPATHLDLEEQIPPLEESGFLLADVTQERVVLRFFRWNSTTQSEDQIDRLGPFRALELAPAPA